jgi:hypothetical protein
MAGGAETPHIAAPPAIARLPGQMQVILTQLPLLERAISP